MGSLTTCLKKAGRALDKEDERFIREAYSDYLRDGLKASEAAQRAVDDLVDTVLTERKGIADQIERKGGVVPPSPLEAKAPKPKVKVLIFPPIPLNFVL